MEADEGLIDHLKRFFPEDAFNRVAAAREDPFEINEKRHAAVMFADISGFTAMSESLGAEEVSLLLSHIFTVLGARVAKYRGMIDKFLGDCILCVFGIADASEPERDACLCALEMMDALPGINAWLAGRQGIYVDLTIGIHSGELVMGIIGSDARLEFTVIGDTVNTASRVQHEANPGEILLTEAVREKVARHFLMANAGERRLKNKRRALQVWRLEGLSLQRATDPGREPIGREGERDLLWAMVQEGPRAENRSVIVHGEAGTGKTLLLNWLCRKASEDDSLAILRLQGDRYHAESSCHAVRSALAEARGAAFGAAENRDAARIAFFDLVQDLLEGRRLLIMAVDDAQYLDGDSRDIVSGLLRDIEGGRIFLLAAQRGNVESLAQAEAALRLEGLDAPSSAELCRRVLGADCAPRLRDWVHGRSMGNPQHIQEILRGLRERGSVDRAGDSWDFEGPPPERVPEGLSGLILQKLDGLPFPHRRAARYASLCGFSVPLDLLEAITGLERAELEAFLARAEELELARLATEGGRAVMRFLHGAAREAIAESLLEEAARHMNLEIAQAILERLEAPGPEAGRGAESLSLAAAHLEAGGASDRAVLIRFRASEAYKAGHDLAAAARQLEKAIALAEGFDAGRGFGAVAFRDADLNSSFSSIPFALELDLSVLHFLHGLCFVGNESAYLEGFERALASREAKDLLFYRIAAARLHTLNYLGRIPPDAVERGLAEAAERAGDAVPAWIPAIDRTFALLSCWSGRTLAEGDWARIEAAFAAMEGAIASALEDPRCRAGEWGNVEACRAAVEALRERLLGERTGLPSAPRVAAIIDAGAASLDSEDDILSFLSTCYENVTGDLGLKIRIELRCIDLAESTGNMAILAQMLSAAGYDYLDMGDAERALALLSRAADICLKLGWRYELSMARHNLSLAHLVRGDWGRALEEARAAASIRGEFPITRETTDWSSQAYPLIIQAAALFLMGRREEACRLASEAASMEVIRLHPDRSPLCLFIRDAASGWDPGESAWRMRLEALASGDAPEGRAFAAALEEGA